MPEWLAYLLGGIATIALAYLTWLASKRTDDRNRITELEKRQDYFERRKGRADDYIGVLREHISDGKPPPPPPYPADYFD